MKIYINRIPATLHNEIFIIEEPGKRMNDVGFYLTFDDKGYVKQNQIIRSGGTDDIKPSFIISEEYTRELLQAFQEYAQSQGIEANSESKTKGKLEATERHLNDMRSLLKLK